MKNYFSDNELKCKCGCGLLNFAPGFREHLNHLRDEFGIPMRVNSCCRCYKHNEAIGGHEKSLHVGDNPYHKTKGTIAIDIDTSAYSRDEREQLIYLAAVNNWSVGLGDTFLHLDLRKYYTGLGRVCFGY